MSRRIEAPVPDGHGALHDERVLGVLGKLLDDGAHAREVGVARVRRRRVHAAEEEAGRGEHVVHRRGEGDPLGVLDQQLGQPGLVDGDLAAAERLDLLLVHVERDDPVPQLGEARRRHQADPADADDAYLFTLSCP